MYVKNKVALVTGGASGIGLCYVKQLLKNGVKGVTIADINQEIGDEVAKSLNAEYGPNRVQFVKADVVNKDELEGAFKKTVEVFKNLDILINNAGVMNDAIWEKQVDINIKGPVNGCLLAFDEYMPKYKSGEEGGVVVNISSIFGVESFATMPVYTATKHAIIGLSKAFADSPHSQQNIRVLTICPGPTETALLTEVENKTPNNSIARYAVALGDYVQNRMTAIQKPDFVAENVLEIINNAENGSVWMIDDNKVNKLYIPSKQDLVKS